MIEIKDLAIHVPQRVAFSNSLTPAGERKSDADVTSGCARRSASEDGWRLEDRPRPPSCRPHDGSFRAAMDLEP